MSQKPRDLRERTFLFASDIVRFCHDVGKEPGAPRQISWQLLDAGTSIGANTEEAGNLHSDSSTRARGAGNRLRDLVLARRPSKFFLLTSSFLQAL